MSNYSKLYWFTRLDHLPDFITAVGVILIIIAAILILVGFVFMDKQFEGEKRCLQIDKFRKLALGKTKLLVPLGLILILITMFIPSKNEAIFIMAGGKTLDYVQSDTSLQKIPYKATSVIVEYLDKTLNDIKTK